MGLSSFQDFDVAFDLDVTNNSEAPIPDGSGRKFVMLKMSPQIRAVTGMLRKGAGESHCSGFPEAIKYHYMICLCLCKMEMRGCMRAEKLGYSVNTGYRRVGVYTRKYPKVLIIMKKLWRYLRKTFWA